MTQLLVSVRNADEAFAAAAGGADIIDVKEPHRGPLGCAAPDVILKIARALGRMDGIVPPLSLALGELTEWQSDDLRSLQNAIQTASPRFLKLGLAETLITHGATSWITEWQRVRMMISGDHAWVAVAYADHEQADSPAIDAVLEVAIQNGCKVLLIDTHTKIGTSLLDEMTIGELQTIRRKTLRNKLKLALAGGVTTADLPQLIPLHPDIIAVRGAVCVHGNRTASVNKNLVEEFHGAMTLLQSS